MESKMESESATSNTKISDSGYSLSGSNSNSQRSASSKSRLSGSTNSSGSSGYCGATSINCSENTVSQPAAKKSKDKEHKKKKAKSTTTTTPPVSESVQANSSEAGTCVHQAQAADTAALADSVGDGQGAGGSGCPNNLTKSLPGATPLEPSIFTSAAESPKETVEKLTLEDGGDVNEKEVAEAEDNNETCNDETFKYLCKNSPLQMEDGFCCVISMYDGVVLYTTPGIASVLGFPKDMWLGRSFIDFVHPKDRETFSTRITTGVGIPLIDSLGKRKDLKSNLYVCLRRYKGLRSSGFGVVEKVVTYRAFQLTVTFKYATENLEASYIGSNRGGFLFIAAMPVYSSYTVPDENSNAKKFGMRHTPSCTFSHVDAEVVTSFGFLPQDMLGKSVFDFYHPEDLPFLKEVYESVMSKCQIAGSVYRSKPYRFAVQNGDFCVVETEWSCFINPWSRRVEFFVGLHKVVQGPKNPDIFGSPKNEESNTVSEEVLKEAKIIRDEILLLLNKELLRSSEVAKLEVSKRCKDLATFMQTIMQEASNSNSKLDSPRNPVLSFSERDSVMLGEISPHHDYYDRESSSETPPSYNQLNYKENIQRFFQSNPVTTVSDESVQGAIQMPTNDELDQEGKTAVQPRNQKCLSPVQNSGASGSGSAGNLSSESNGNTGSGTTIGTNNSSNNSYKPPHLTEEILSKHNENMETIMRQRHRELRSSNKADREKKLLGHGCENTTHSGRTGMGEKTDKHGKSMNTLQVQGVKRSGSHSGDNDGHKMSKHQHQSAPNEDNQTNESPAILTSNQNNYNTYGTHVNDVKLWPPFSMTMTSIRNTPPYGVTAVTNNVNNYTAGMFPVYYFPSQQGQHQIELGNVHHQTHQPQFQVQYVPSMMYNYNPIFSTSPIFCSPMAVVPLSVPPQSQRVSPATPDARHGSASLGATPSAVDNKPSPIGCQRPASQATSVKAERGSALGSVASIGGANRAMSECSRKDLGGLQSVCSPDSPLVSPPDREIVLENNVPPTKNLPKVVEPKAVHSFTPDEESSSSFYSFLKTDTGSGSNDDSNSVDTRNKSTASNVVYKKPRARPSRVCDPPWLELVSVTPDLVYRYQMTLKNIQDILEADLNTLKDTKQPILVNDQLDQLYLEMEIDGLSKKLMLDEGITSSSSSDENGSLRSNEDNQQAKKKRRSYSSMMMIYEEDAPFPPPHH